MESSFGMSDLRPLKSCVDAFSTRLSGFVVGLFIYMNLKSISIFNSEFSGTLLTTMTYWPIFAWVNWRQRNTNAFMHFSLLSENVLKIPKPDQLLIKA